MSGTSLDGLDIALCEFFWEDKWHYNILFAETQSYNDEFRTSLKHAKNYHARDFMRLDNEVGKYFGMLVNNFLDQHYIDKNSITAIASHGQTIFHQPDQGFTTQIGSGAQIAAITGITTICDFRSLDVALGGQGAPLVPIGDELLFGEYDYCINLGGIANISFRENSMRKSFDIGFANMASNYLSEKLGKPYDENGLIASLGNFDQNLFDQLNSLDYFETHPPKSLGKEYFDQTYIKTLNNTTINTEDQLNTFGKHLAFQISKHLKNGTCLVTGGGSYNHFWMEEIRTRSSAEIITPSSMVINFKEALIFAFLGLLRLEKQNNTLQSVTGAKKDSIGGCIYLM